MIVYDKYRWWSLRVLLKCSGSAIPHVLPFSIIAGAWAYALRYYDLIPPTNGGDLFFHPAPAMNFFLVVSLALTFHTSQAYSRYWEARTHLQSMSTKWLDAAFEACLFDAPADLQGVAHGPAWRLQVVHLCSLLHGSAISYLSRQSGSSLNVIGGIDQEEASALEDAGDQVYLVKKWLVEMFLSRQADGGLSQQGPIVARLYGAVADGISAFNQACKIEDTPFPFPYVQMIQVFMIALTFFLPVLIVSFERDTWLAVPISAVAVGCFHCLSYAAHAMESPFGERANDLPLADIQDDFNERLFLLLPDFAPPFPHRVCSSAAASITYAQVKEKILAQEPPDQDPLGAQRTTAGGRGSRGGIDSADGGEGSSEEEGGDYRGGFADRFKKAAAPVKHPSLSERVPSRKSLLQQQQQPGETEKAQHAAVLQDAFNQQQQPQLQRRGSGKGKVGLEEGHGAKTQTYAQTQQVQVTGSPPRTQPAAVPSPLTAVPAYAQGPPPGAFLLPSTQSSIMPPQQVRRFGSTAMRDRSAANRLKERKAAATTGPMTRMKRPANGTGGPLWGGSLLERLDLARRASDTRVSLVWQQGGGGSLNDSDQQGETPRERTPAGDAAVSAPYPPLGRSATMEERPSKGQMHLLQSPQLGFPGGGALGEREREETVDLEGQLRAPLLDKSE